MLRTWLATRKLARLVALRAWLEISCLPETPETLETLETLETPETFETPIERKRKPKPICETFETVVLLAADHNFKELGCKGNVDDAVMSIPIGLFAKKAKSHL
ncbi:MAG: hypothetical protein ACI30R_01605 [Sodaliphilus sp.]